MREYRFCAPNNFDELFAQINGKQDAQIAFLAGGTDVVPRINMERDEVPFDEKPPMLIVSLAGLGLDKVEEKDGVLKIGAMTKLSELENNAAIAEKTPALYDAIQAMAGKSVKNAATIGGNIMNASPAADTLPALFVLDASLTLKSAAGEREVKVSEFFTGPGKTAAKEGEILAAICIKPGTGRSSFQKLGRRAAESLSVVNAAAYIEMQDGKIKAAKIAVGSAAPTVKSCQKAADKLIGLTPEEKAVKEASAFVNDELSPIDDIRASAWYRLEVAPAIAARAVLAACERGGAGQ